MLQRQWQAFSAPEHTTCEQFTDEWRNRNAHSDSTSRLEEYQAYRRSESVDPWTYSCERLEYFYAKYTTPTKNGRVLRRLRWPVAMQFCWSWGFGGRVSWGLERFRKARRCSEFCVWDLWLRPLRSLRKVASKWRKNGQDSGPYASSRDLRWRRPRLSSGDGSRCDRSGRVLWRWRMMWES